MEAKSKIYVAGHRGMVGSAIVRCLAREGYGNVVTRSREELDLLNTAAVERFFAEERPEVVVFAAARVGGIKANNDFPAEFLQENLMMEMNGIGAAWRQGCRRFLFLGSSCIYPREAPQPMPEDCLLGSPLEKTNEAYALAKICGLKYCSYLRKEYGAQFHSAMPTNLYGPGDNYHPEHSHVLPALIRRFHEAKESGAEEVVIWGSGKPRREFLHVDDLAEALLFLLQVDEPPDWINVGSGEEVTIRELAELVAEVVGFAGTIRTDPGKPDGTPRKLMDNQRLRALGWKPRIGLREGVEQAYADFRERLESGNLRG